MRTLRETYMELIYMGSRKRQDLLSKLEVWGSWERAEEAGEKGRRAEKKLNKNIKKNS